MSLMIAASAKVNLTVDITGIAPGGYHELDMIMQSVELFDIITIDKTKSAAVELTCTRGNAPTGEGNIAYAAAKAFFDYTGLPFGGVSITIEKHIPIAAGMAGGSADAAAVIIGLNRIFNTNLDQEALCEIGLKVGADVPFCITGGTVRVKGIGEKLTPVKPLTGGYFVLAKSAEKESTGSMYKKFDNELYGSDYPRADSDKMEEAIASENIAEVGKNICNVFDLLWQDESIDKAKAVMKEFGALGCAVSGSGPTVFGYFDDYIAALKCKKSLREFCDFVFVCRPCMTGCAVAQK